MEPYRRGDAARYEGGGGRRGVRRLVLANEPLLLSSWGICLGLSGGPDSFGRCEKNAERADGRASGEESSKLLSISSWRDISLCMFATTHACVSGRGAPLAKRAYRLDELDFQDPVP